MLEKYSRWMDAFSDALGRFLSYHLLAMTFLTLGVIVAANVFKSGWVWPGELVVYLHAALFTLAASYTLLHDAHVRIDLFYGRLGEVGRARINLLGVFLFLIPVGVVIIYYSWSYVVAAWSVRESSPEGDGLPGVFLLKTCLLLMPALLIAQGLSLAAKSWLTLIAAKKQ